MTWTRLASQLGVSGNLNSGQWQRQHLNPISQEQAAAAQLAAYRQQQPGSEPKPYRFKGQDMDWKQFVDTLFPEDSPEKTMFTLRHRPE